MVYKVNLIFPLVSANTGMMRVAFGYCKDYHRVSDVYNIFVNPGAGRTVKIMEVKT